MRLPPVLRFTLVACVPALGIAVCWVQAAADRAPTAKEWTLEAAALAGDMRQVRQFLDAGSDVNASYGRAASPLAFAAFAGQYDVASFLMSRGARVNGRTDVAGRGAIHWAAIGDQPEMVELLLARGADVNASTRSGETPLDVAIELGSPAAAAALVAGGADIWATDADGVTPLDVALTIGSGGSAHDDDLDDDDDNAGGPAGRVRVPRVAVMGWASRFILGSRP